MVDTLLKNLRNQSLMFSFGSSTVNENIILALDATFFMFEDCVHLFLAGGGGVLQSKWHHCILE